MERLMQQADLGRQSMGWEAVWFNLWKQVFNTARRGYSKSKAMHAHLRLDCPLRGACPEMTTIVSQRPALVLSARHRSCLAVHNHGQP